MVVIPVCVVKPAFQPPERVTPLLIRTTSVPVAVYVPTATRIVSPADAFPIAALIVWQGLPALKQVFALLPVVATYQVATRRAGRCWSLDGTFACADLLQAVSIWLKCRLMLPRW